MERFIITRNEYFVVSVNTLADCVDFLIMQDLDATTFYVKDTIDNVQVAAVELIEFFDSKSNIFDLKDLL